MSGNGEANMTALYPGPIKVQIDHHSADPHGGPPLLHDATPVPAASRVLDVTYPAGTPYPERTGNIAPLPGMTRTKTPSPLRRLFSKLTNLGAPPV